MTTEPDPIKGTIVDWFLVDDPVSTEHKPTSETIRRYLELFPVPPEGMGFVGPILTDWTADDVVEAARELRERMNLLP